MKKIIFSLSILTIGFFTAHSQTIINSGFENWEVDSSSGTPIWNPTGWLAFNLGETNPDAVSQSTNFHGGKYSAKIIPTEFFGMPFPGILGYREATTQKLKYLNGYYKSGLTTLDTFMIGLIYSNSKTMEEYTIGQTATGSKSVWTPFNIQLDLPSGFTPDTFSITIMVFGEGKPFGMLDDLSFSNTPIGSAFGKPFINSVKKISHNVNFNEKLSPNPVNNFATLNFYVAKPGKVQVIITNLLGKEIKRIDNNETAYGQQHVQLDTEDINPGIYFYSIITSYAIITRKFVVSK